MNGRTIKRRLSNKINEWTEQIRLDGSKEAQAALAAIKADAIISGGAISSLLQGEEPHDYDVYFQNVDSCLAVASYYVNLWNKEHSDKLSVEYTPKTGRIECVAPSAGAVFETDELDETDELNEPEKQETTSKSKQKKSPYRPIFISTNAISLSDDVQIVIRFYGDIDTIHTNYDFVHTTCSYHYYTGKLSLPADALEAIINKELVYKGSKYPVASVIRTNKFINRGWHIGAGQYVKMALQISQLDLTNFEVFKDQLTGVDTTFFAGMIAKLDKLHKTGVDNFSTDYIINLIDKMYE